MPKRTKRIATNGNTQPDTDSAEQFDADMAAMHAMAEAILAHPNHSGLVRLAQNDGKRAVDTPPPWEAGDHR